MPPVERRAVPAANAGREGSRATLDQEVSDAAHGMDLDSGAMVAEFAPQMVDVDGNGVGAQLIVDAVELVLQQRLRDHAPRPAHQMFEDGRLAPWQYQDLIA